MLRLRPDFLVVNVMLLATPGAWAGGDAVAGKAIFGQCLACHAIEANAADTIGPNLRGVLGKAAASNRPGFAYSDALKAARLTWDEATLDAWLKNPGAMVPGNKMEFVGLSQRKKREDVMAYMAEALK